MVETLQHKETTQYIGLTALRHVCRIAQIIVDFYNLFGKMIQPLSQNRISAENAYKEFKSLINKYKKGIPKKKKSRMKRVKRRSIGRKKAVVKRGRKKTVVKRKNTVVKRKKKTIRRGNKNRRALK